MPSATHCTLAWPPDCSLQPSSPAAWRSLRHSGHACQTLTAPAPCSDAAGGDWQCARTPRRDGRVLSALLLVDRVTLSWTRRTLAGSALVVVLGIVISGAPAGVQALGWIFTGVLTAAGLLFACITLFRHDYSMIPVAVATMSAVGAIARGAGRPYPVHFRGSIVGAAILILVGRWWFVALRRRQVTIRRRTHRSRAEWNAPSLSHSDGAARRMR